MITVFHNVSPDNTMSLTPFWHSFLLNWKSVFKLGKQRSLSWRGWCIWEPSSVFTECVAISVRCTEASSSKSSLCLAFKGLKQRHRPLLSSADSQLPLAHCSHYTQAAHFGVTRSDPVGGQIIQTRNLKSSTFVSGSHKLGKHANMPSGKISPTWALAQSMLLAALALCFGVLLVQSPVLSDFLLIIQAAVPTPLPSSLPPPPSLIPLLLMFYLVWLCLMHFAALNLWSSSCLSLLSARMTGMNCHTYSSLLTLLFDWPCFPVPQGHHSSPSYWLWVFFYATLFWKFIFPFTLGKTPHP